jgi:terminase small subunit / prophage DNA-packing protein
MQLNREKLADFLGCSLRTIDEYSRQGMPGDSPKRAGDQWRFESGAVVGWLRERERSDALGEVARVDEAEAKRRKLAAEAALAELDLALKQGAAVSLKDFETAWSAMIGAARAKLLGMGMALGPEVALMSDPAECGAIIDAAVKESLRELSEGPGQVHFEQPGAGESDVADEAPEPVVRSAAGSDGKPVGGRRAAAKPRVKR